MLVSLKAGGTGLNLTAADHVFLCDPWWNPAVEDQAADRAHRIGQTRPVIVYRLVAAAPSRSASSRCRTASARSSTPRSATARPRRASPRTTCSRCSPDRLIARSDEPRRRLIDYGAGALGDSLGLAEPVLPPAPLFLSGLSALSGAASAAAAAASLV